MHKPLDLDVRKELLRKLARPALQDSAVYPALFLVLGHYTSIAPSSLGKICFSLVVVAGLLRINTARKIYSHSNPAIHSLKREYKLNVHFTQVTWCLFSAFTILREGTGTWNALFLVLLSSGIAAGGTFSLAPDYQTGRLFIFCSWVGHAFPYFFAGDWATTVVVTMYCVYLVIQARTLNQFLICSMLDQRRLVVQSTSLKKANQEATEALQKAEDATLVKSRFLSTMSHEIRTPLNGVLGTNLLLLDSRLDSEQEEYAKTIQNCGEALLTLVNDILDFSKLEAGKISEFTEDFDIRILVQQSVDIVRTQVEEKGLDLQVSFGDGLPNRVSGDFPHLRQILLNLLSNAVKFTNEGRIEVRATLNAEDKERLWVSLYVKDTGVGISEDQQDLLFQPFEQASSSDSRFREGTGLGLAISRSLAEHLRGSLSMESVEGEGSTFTLTVPFERAKSPVAEALMDTRIRLEANEIADSRILVVEDNPTNQMILERLLSKAGYRCDTVDDGLQAVEAATLCDYSLILMDCHMPILDGYEATRRILHNLGDRAPTIVAVTANISSEDRELCFQAGMKAVLSKPVRLARLQEVLETFLTSGSPNE